MLNITFVSTCDKSVLHKVQSTICLINVTLIKEMNILQIYQKRDQVPFNQN